MCISLALAEYCRDHELTVVTAESCTAGMISSIIAETAGSSSWLDTAFVTYTEDAKQKILYVPADVIKDYGVVSEETARSMVEGARRRRPGKSIYVSTTGYAGPGGGTEEYPVGTVCFAWLYDIEKIPGLFIVSKTVLLEGDRNTVRKAAAEYSLSEVVAFLSNIYA